MSNKSNKAKPENIPIGNRLREVRERKNMTDVELALQLQRDRTTIDRYESGATTIPLTIFEKLSNEWGLATAVYIQYGRKKSENIIDLNDYTFSQRKILMDLSDYFIKGKL